MKPGSRMKAAAHVSVQSSKETSYDSHLPHLVEVEITETFTGEMEGESVVHALKFAGNKQSATLVSMQRFLGSLNGRKGTFVLHGRETVAAGRITATWSVVPGSATGELIGLNGDGGFEGEFGKGSKASLEYWFD